MNLGRLSARVIIGGLLIGHGTQKLKGWFVGPGVEDTAGTMEVPRAEPRPAATRPPRGATETVGGAMLAAGFATSLASAALMGTMITAIRKVHPPQGPWNVAGGYEYNLVLIAALLALAEKGRRHLARHCAGAPRRGARPGPSSRSSSAPVPQRPRSRSAAAPHPHRTLCPASFTH